MYWLFDAISTSKQRYNEERVMNSENVLLRIEGMSKNYGQQAAVD
ncbi:hypothetical protein [Streptococcus suis]